MNPPKVSIIMAVYNGEKYLTEAIESILNQTLSDSEFIIINDGSTDNSKAIINKYLKEQVRIIENSENIGLTKSLNRGLSVAKGSYIARIDADDTALPGRLQKQAEFLDKNRHIHIVGSWFDEYDHEGNKIRTNKAKIHSILIRWRLLFGNAFGHSTVMLRKDCIQDSLYNESVRYGQDYELWSRLCWKWDSANIPEVLVHRRVTRDSITIQNKEEHMKIGRKISMENLSWVLDKTITDNDLYDFRIFNGLSAKNIGPEELICIIQKIDQLKKHFLSRFKYNRKEINILDFEITSQAIRFINSNCNSVLQKLYLLFMWYSAARPKVINLLNGYASR